MNTHLLIPAFVLVLTFSLSSAAIPEQWLQSGLIHPDVIEQIKPELGLTPAQESGMATVVADARAQAGPLEQQLREQEQSLHEMLRQPELTADDAGAQLAKVLSAEAAIKQLQLRTLLALRNVLTPDQQKKAQTLGPPAMAAKSGLEAQVAAKAGRLRAAVEALGEKPTEAMAARGAEIEQLMKSGDLKAADSALDKLMADAHADEPYNSGSEPDFSQFEPGDTSLDALRERFSSVESGAQQILSIPLFRHFMKARDAFESAKASEDAVAVGRVLTWAEQQLKKD